MRPAVPIVGTSTFLLAALIPTACSTGACSDIGAEEGVSVDFWKPAIVRAAHLGVTVCIAGECAERTFDEEQDTSPGEEQDTSLDEEQDTAPRIVFVSLPVPDDANADVTVKAATTDGLLFDAATRTHSQKFQPNGPGCGPTVWQVHLRADGDGQLSVVSA